MLTELKINQIYVWLFPESAAGLKFKVTKILKASYLLQYLNYPYQIPVIQTVEISSVYIQSHILNILHVPSILNA